MKRNLRFLLSYDGTRYRGWQENGSSPTVEGTLRKVLETILQQEVYLEAASRTDAGVHATGQVASCIAELDDQHYSRLQYRINALLPPDIRILELSCAPKIFHPTIDCRWKEYRYQLYTGNVLPPLQRCYLWHVPKRIDLEKMREVSHRLPGRRDFAALCNRHVSGPPLDTVRTLYSIDISPIGASVVITVRGRSFLYKMVRNIVGSLVSIGSGKLTEAALLDALRRRDRQLAGLTAPAKGLTLTHVSYADRMPTSRRPLQEESLV